MLFSEQVKEKIGKSVKIQETVQEKIREFLLDQFTRLGKAWSGRRCFLIKDTDVVFILADSGWLPDNPSRGFSYVEMMTAMTFVFWYLNEEGFDPKVELNPLGYLTITGSLKETK